MEENCIGIKYKTLIISTLALFVCSCSTENKYVSLYTVVPKNFESTITIDGSAEPIESLNIVCPRSGSQGTIAFLIEDGTWVEEGDIVCSIEKQALQTEYDKLVLDYESAKANIEKTKADLKMQYALLEAEAKNNDAETQIAQLDSSRLKYYPEKQRLIKELELKIVKIRRKKIEAKLNAAAIIQQSEIKKLEIQIQQYVNRIEATKQFLAALVLKAPKRGLAIVAESPMTGNKLVVGDNVWNSMPIVSIPQMEKMKMKIFASERDYRYISVNDSISFSFDALPDNIAWGKIAKKTPVGQQIKEDSKVKQFEIEASIDSTLSLPEPGFTAKCHIFLKQVNDTIVIPQIAVFEQDSMKVVYVENKKGFEMRQITLAESSPKETVVSNGLSKNERIALSMPNKSQIKSKKILSDSLQITKK